MSSRRELANAIRALSMDAVQRAKSGHPGMPMGMADIAEVLWNDYLRHNPADPTWINRDRFVVSNGHGSMLLYALLHLTGYDMTMDDLKQFRQLHSKTPGHPEHGYAPGIETTTGPLGQGLANAVGMALAERMLAAQFNQPGFNIIDHHTYVFLGDGCLMEGISHEVSSLAGTWGLGKLIAFWDNNAISIDGHVEGWFTDDTVKRFEAYGWHVIADIDGHDAAEVKQAIHEAKAVSNKPTLIACRTIIGFGAPTLAGSHQCHGAPLGDEEIAATKQHLKWPHDAFVIPDTIYQGWNARVHGEQWQTQWQALFTSYQQKYPDLAQQLQRRVTHQLPATWPKEVTHFIQKTQQEGASLATRTASLHCLNAYVPLLPELVGGSADLTGSNLTAWKGCHVYSTEHPAGNYLHYGVREFGMSAIMNGLALHGGIIPFGGTFLTFCDYARNAVRMAALMKQRSIFVYTHDSLGLGEDGPTHQPVEHAAMLRLTPHIHVWRPADSVETAVAWRSAIERHDGPSCLLLSRQTLPHCERDAKTLANISRGGYILSDSHVTPELIFIATGSEIELAIGAAQLLRAEGKAVRVVSMPCTEIFDQQEDTYREAVLPRAIRRRIAVEAGAMDYWYKYVGLDGIVVGLNRFGESAPAKDVFKVLGFTIDNVLKTAKQLLTQESEIHNGNSSRN
jgi:transketolase